MATMRHFSYLTAIESPGELSEQARLLSEAVRIGEEHGLAWSATNDTGELQVDFVGGVEPVVAAYGAMFVAGVFPSTIEVEDEGELAYASGLVDITVDLG